MNEQLQLFAPPPAETKVYIGARGAFLKIGVTKHPRQRARQLGLRLLYVVPGTPEDERRLHERFRSARIDREWFMPTPELLAFAAGAGA
jgi:Meiotically up-regulated gene 113